MEYEDEEHIENFFDKNTLSRGSSKEKEEDKDEGEWFIGDSPPKEDVRVVYVRPKGFETHAS